MKGWNKHAKKKNHYNNYMYCFGINFLRSINK